MATNKKDLFNRLNEVSKNAPFQESSDGESNKKKTHTQEEPTATSPTAKKTTSLLMTPYIIEGFREKLAKDGTFDRKKETTK